jgi:hypothetical protein
VVSYAAQTRDAAKLKLREDHEPLLAASPFHDRYETVWQFGSERLRFDNGSVWGVQATTLKSGHGPTLDLGVLDEGWSQIDARVDQAWLPAMMTRPNSQFWLPSTMGTDASTYFNAKVDNGRALVEAGQQQDVAYFEWSLTEDDDPMDPANWMRCMPAIGYTVTVGKIRQAAAGMELSEFARAYCNIKKGTKAAGGLLDVKHFETLANPRGKLDSPITFGVAVSPFGHHAAVAAVGPSLADPEIMHVELLKHGTGVDWVMPYLRVRVPRWHPFAVAVDFGGPANVLKQDILNETRFGREPWSPPAEFDAADAARQTANLITVPTINGWAQASGEMREAIKQSKIVHLGVDKQPPLQRAVAGVDKRPLGDAWAWGRKGDVDITPLESITVARWAYLLRRPFYDLDNYDVAESVY